MDRKTGRSKGSRNRGYWFRKARGWFVTEGRSAIPLCDVRGNHIKSADYAEEARDAYARYILQAGQPSKRPGISWARPGALANVGPKGVPSRNADLVVLQAFTAMVSRPGLAGDSHSPGPK
jgi:hypothetical protein